MSHKLTKQASEAYEQGEPILTDQEFDLLSDNGLDQDTRNFRNKVAHHLPMGSLSKLKTPEDLAKWMYRHPECRFVIMPKLDGASMALSYRMGKLDRAVTRGDGICGNEITDNVKHTRCPIVTLNNEVDLVDFEARAEAVIPSTYGRQFESNLRNIAAGKLNAKGPSETLGLIEFVFFDVYGDNLETWNQKKQAIQALPYNSSCPHIEFQEDELNPLGAYDQLEAVYEAWKENFNVGIDGLVITAIPDPDAPMDIPEMIPVNKAAIKYQDEAVDAEVSHIEWNLGKHGKMAPVVVLSTAVEIDSTNVQRISASNFSIVKTLGLGPGALVRVVKANQIIPYIQAVIKITPHAIEPPDCPECREPTVLNDNEIDALCVNLRCEGLAEVRLRKQLECFEIDFVSDSTVEKLFAAGFNTLEKVFDMSNVEMAAIEGFGMKSATYFVEALSNAKLTEAKVFKMVGLKGLGERKGTKLLDHYGSLEQMLKTIFEKEAIDDIPSFGDIQKEIILLNLWPIRELMNTLKELGVEIIPHAKEQKTMKVCATGKAPGMTRADLESLLTDKGYTLLSGVTKDCDLLLCEDTSGNSSKLQKARKFGTKIQSYDEFLRGV